MTSKLDLIIHPLVRYYGQDRPGISGLHLARPPRRSARGRSLDQLVIHFAQEGNAPLTPKTQEQLLNKLVKSYFKTPGSATAALRTVAESLNSYLLDRNLRSASRGLQTVGILTLAVLREDRMYIAQSGPSHIFRVTSNGVEQLHDADISGRGLGLSRATEIRYNQFDLTPGDLLILTPKAPSVWTSTTLRGLHRLEVAGLVPRLLHQVGPELNAVLVKAQKGSGEMELLTSEELEATTSMEEAQAVVSSAAPPGQEIVPDSSPPAATQTSPEGTPAVVADSQAVESKPRVIRRLPSVPVKQILSTLARALGDTLGSAFQWMGTLVRRMLPDESIFSIPSSVMILIALGVPLMIVAMASVVYFQRGRESLYQGYFSRAQTAASQAAEREDPNELREAWRSALGYVDQAEEYKETEESRALRAYALTVLDGLDMVERLSYQAAIVGGVPRTAEITRMVASAEGDLYMLNATDGSVLRAEFGSQGFVLDRDFICGPMPQPLIVGPLVDIAVLPPGDVNHATLLGMDANGNLIKCIPGGELPLAFQMGPPDTNWGSPLALDLDGRDLYVLDPITNAVWIYWGRDEYRERPRFYFGDQVPPMQDVIDLAVGGEDLYLLHADGHMTACTFSLIQETPTRCNDPVTFTDLRPGRESGETITGALFSQVLNTPPPDPSIYLLDPEDQAIYHFSVRLTLQRQYRPQYGLSDEPATAFTISPNRLALLAIGDLVYYAALP